VQLYLIRHPRPAVAEGICYGRTDLALAEAAAECAARLRSLLPAEIAVYSSPLRRCRELAEHLHPAPQFDERLMEMHFGAWEMRPWNAIGRAALDDWMADPLGFVPPGGESAAMLRDRVAAFIAERQREGCAALALVTHAGVMKVVAGALRGRPTAEWFAMSFDYGTLTTVRLSHRARRR